MGMRTARYHQVLRPATARALALVQLGVYSPYTAARMCGVSLTTIYRHMHKGVEAHKAQITEVAKAETSTI